MDCSSNYYLTSLQLSNNPKLKSVSCNWNKLSRLIVNNCPQFEYLDCSHNELTELDLSEYSSLQNLNCSENKLKELDLQKLPKLQTLYCWENQLNNLNVDKLTKLTRLKCYNNPIPQQAFKKLKASVVKNCPNLERKDSQLTSSAQEYLDWTYPKETRSDITWFNKLCNKSLEGSLKLECFTKLDKIECYGNQLTSLDLSQNWNLWRLWISNNKFARQDLSFLGHLFNLTSLKLDNNQFVGSLKPLRVMIKLEQLSIRDTDIDSGLEYLPKRATEFDCSNYQRPEAKIKTLEQELRKYGESREKTEFGFYSHMYVLNNFFGLLEAWRNANLEKTELAYQEALQELLRLKQNRLSQKKKELVDFGKESKKQLSQLLSRGKRTQETSREHEEWQKKLKSEITKLERGITEVAKLQQELNAKQQQTQIEQLPK